MSVYAYARPSTTHARSNARRTKTTLSTATLVHLRSHHTWQLVFVFNIVGWSSDASVSRNCATDYPQKRPFVQPIVRSNGHLPNRPSARPIVRAWLMWVRPSVLSIVACFNGYLSFANALVGVIGRLPPPLACAASRPCSWPYVRSSACPLAKTTVLSAVYARPPSLTCL